MIAWIKVTEANNPEEVEDIAKSSLWYNAKLCSFFKKVGNPIYQDAMRKVGFSRVGDLFSTEGKIISLEDAMGKGL